MIQEERKKGENNNWEIEEKRLKQESEVLREDNNAGYLIKEAVSYFKSNSGFERFFQGMREKFESYEHGLRATIVLRNLNKQECQALSGIMRKNYKVSKIAQIKIINFRNCLEKTRFAGIDIKKLVETYFGIQIVTYKNRKEFVENAREEFFQKILKEEKGTRSYEILNSILQEKTEIYTNLRSEYSASPKSFQSTVKSACKAINNLPKTPILLSVFSAQIFQNPHELDRDTKTGKMFLSLLAAEKKQKRPNGAEEIIEFYFQNKLLVDSFSNMVLCKNIVAKQNGNLHPGWLGFFEKHEAMQITLAQLAQIDQLETQAKFAIVVENPGVFSVLAEQTDKIPLICTYGQVKIAGLSLLDLLVKNKVKLFYSGDIDPEGILIADKLKHRYSKDLILIGFEDETYLKNFSQIHLSKLRLKKLKKLKNRRLKKLVKYLEFYEVAAYEEQNLNSLIQLVKDLERRIEK